jgi:hypothetical protein
VKCFAAIARIAIFIGYASIPAAISLRLVGADYVEKKKVELKSAAPVEPPAPAAKETH